MSSYLPPSEHDREDALEQMCDYWLRDHTELQIQAEIKRLHTLSVHAQQASEHLRTALANRQQEQAK